MKTLSIISQKGGSGKTTVAIHLAVAAQQNGHNVLIADLDEQASTTLWGNSRAYDFPVVQPVHSAALPQLASTAASEGFDFLVIDTAPQSDKSARAAAEASDGILIPCRPSIMDLRAIQNTLRLMEITDLRPQTLVSVLLTQVDSFGQLHQEARETLANLNTHVLENVIGRRVAFNYPLTDGRVAQEYEPHGKAAQEIRAVYMEVCGLINMVPTLNNKLTEVSNE